MPLFKDMDFKLNKKEETDTEIIFDVSMPEEELKKEKYYTYLKNRYINVDSESPRPSFADINSYFENWRRNMNQLSLIAYKKYEPEIVKLIAEEAGIPQEEAIVQAMGAQDSGPIPHAEYILYKTKPLDLEGITEYLPLASIDESRLPDIEDEVNRELEELRAQNLRLIPTEKPIDENSTVSITLLKEADGESEEIMTTNADAFELLFQYGAEIAEGKGHSGDKVSVNPEILERYKTLYGEGDFSYLINQVYESEYPELDDDFAAEVSEFDTLEELKEDLRHKKYAYYLHDKEGEMFNRVFENYLRDQKGLTNETLLELITRPDVAVTDLISYQSTLLDNPLLVPMNTDALGMAAIELKDHYLDEFAKKLLDSEIGQAVELDEEACREQLEYDLVQRAKQRGQNADLIGHAEDLLPLYMAQHALNEYLKVQEA